MKGRLAALLIALILAFALPMAFADDSRIESIEYKGFGILKIEFLRDCDWYTSAEIGLTDGDGNALAYVYIGGEAEECYLRAEALKEGSPVNLSFRMGQNSQSLSFTAETGLEHKVKADGTILRRDKDGEACDFCKLRGHDEDFCPERIDASSLSDDPAELARLFDIDRCDFCGGMGHDDERCPERETSKKSKK